MSSKDKATEFVVCPFCGSKPYMNRHGRPYIKHKKDCYFGEIYIQGEIKIQNKDKWNSRAGIRKNGES